MEMKDIISNQEFKTCKDYIGCHIDEIRKDGFLDIFLNAYPECKKSFKECEDYYNRCEIYD